MSDRYSLEAHSGAQALDVDEQALVASWIDALRARAMNGGCRKARRAAAVVCPDRKMKLVAVASISGCPPDCWPACREQKDFGGRPGCRHAEQNALQLAEATRVDLSGAWMVHLKFDEDGQPVPSGRRLCPVCVPEMILAGIGWLVLYHDDGWWKYPLENTPLLFVVDSPDKR